MKLVTTELAALYLMVMSKPKEPIQAYTESDIERAKRRIYNMARSGQLTRHGGTERGQARWSLTELHALLQQPKTGV